MRGLGYVQGPGGRGSGADPKDKVDVALAISRAAGPFPTRATAIESYRRLVRLDPDNPLLNLRLADALLRAGREKESLAYFRRVIRAGPRTTDAFVGLATALANLGQLDESRQALMEALELDPKSGQAHFNLGELARLAGRDDEARRHYEAALDDEATRTRRPGASGAVAMAKRRSLRAFAILVVRLAAGLFAVLAAFGPRPARPAFLLITLDTLRADRSAPTAPLRARRRTSTPWRNAARSSRPP